MITFAGISPDIDGLGLLVDLATKNSVTPTNYWGGFHHVLHTLVFSLVISVAVYVLAGKKKFQTAALALFMFHAHLLCDIVGSRGPDGFQWPIPYLSPFSRWPQLSWAGQWELNAWPNIIFSLMLIVFIYFVAKYRKRTPFEVVSSRMNDTCLGLLRCK